MNRLSNYIYVQALTYKAQVPLNTHTHIYTHTRTHTRSTAFAHVPGGVRWRHELVAGPARREQVEGNVVCNSIIGRVVHNSIIGRV